MNNKISLQREIFIYGLTFILLAINLLEIISTEKDKLLLRIIKSVLTIFLTYCGAAIIFKLLNVKTWNIFYYYRGAPVITFILITLFLTLTGIAIIEVIKKIICFALTDLPEYKHKKLL